MKPNLGIRICMLFLLSACASLCNAGIQVGGTRVIFPSTDREAAIQVRNEGADDIMIQSWIEPAPDATVSEVPFAITPSLARLSYKKQQMLRIFYRGIGLPENRESVFWLNIQEIPQISEAENSLQIAFRQRLKLFFRPVTILGTPDEAAKKIRWELKSKSNGLALLANNATGFYVSLASAVLLINGKEHPAETKMIPPFSSVEIEIKGTPSHFDERSEVRWESINDYGALIKNQASISL